MKKCFALRILRHVRSCLLLDIFFLCLSCVSNTRFEFQINSKVEWDQTHQQHTNTAPNPTHLYKLFNFNPIWPLEGTVDTQDASLSHWMSLFAFSHRPPPWMWRTRGCPRSGKYLRANWRRAKVCFSTSVVRGHSPSHCSTTHSHSIGKADTSYSTHPRGGDQRWML